MNQIRPIPLLIKAISLFTLANLLFAILNPPVGRISIYNTLLPGRTRFPFGTGIHDTNITVDDMDAIFAAHIISAPKAPNEFRVIILGDSSIWGTLLHPDQTLDAQLNRIRFGCAGKTLRFYNLGYPHPSVLQDLLIMQRAMQYQPDFIIWPISLNSLRPKPLNQFRVHNVAAVTALIEKYQLKSFEQQIIIPEPSFFERTIIGQRRQLSRLFLLQSLAFPWAATGLDTSPDTHYTALSNEVSSSLLFGTFQTPADIESFLLLDHLNAGVNISAGVPLLFVNEPMYLPTGENTEIRYNAMFPRWAYDQYRRIIVKLMRTNHWNYVDLWKAIPPQQFTDYELHLSPLGEQNMAKRLKAPLKKLLCP